MPEIEHSDVYLQDNDGNHQPGQLQTTRYDQGDRVKRALQRLGFFWLLAGITLFIPIAHFVLVPGFLIAGPVMAYLTYRTEAVRNHTTGTCPVCGEAVTLAMDAKDNLPKWTYCPSCNAPLQISERG
jgi:hypothetical protein